MEKTWSPEEICLAPETFELKTLARSVYRKTCRTDFDAPGFCLVDLGSEIDSCSLRQLMASLKSEMSLLHESITGKKLVYLSAARFDQQETTRPHLDGGPEECFLMLGYEPTEVDSEFEIFDYARAAFDLEISPQEIMEKHNPMFQAGYELLRPYRIDVPCFRKTNYQIVCINNSSAAYSPATQAWQGTLHTATILTPDESKRRVINSTMIASVPVGTPETVTPDEINDFISTSVVRRRGYSNPQLEDDV